MSSPRNPIKGAPIQGKPAGISRCGMSHAKFAQHRSTKKWFDLSEEGQVIGSALDLDFTDLILSQDQTHNRRKRQKN
ncbi:hypothetical protein [Acaryochloris marina]|uniref:hypothetical protein n=1 Tax=Acaryochloris marina TaxID=155978 RepID=UPI0021C35EC8|nr:hypothetical protein [Acaryochloris marina]BDM83343.1 hypothetical protein AM10699_62040 [Acaryochloris marina MBIC10699]